MLLRGYVGVVLMARLAAGSGGTATGDPEDTLKAAAILSFLRFTEWRGPAAEPLVVGVYGRARFAALVQQSLAGKRVGGRGLVTRGLKSAAEARGCNFVYAATTRRAEVAALLDAVRAGQVLTVGEANEFLEQGGVVALFLLDGKLTFEVSRTALEQSGLSISSKLLRLGNVRDVRLKEGKP